MRLPAAIVFLFACLLAMPQMKAQNVVTGTVVDDKDEPLIGVSIVADGSKATAVTDIDGKFRINVNQGGTLLVSYIGYESQKVPVKGNDLHIVLKEDN